MDTQREDDCRRFSVCVCVCVVFFFLKKKKKKKKKKKRKRNIVWEFATLLETVVGVELLEGDKRAQETMGNISLTWASSNDNLFQSNCEAILGKTPDWET